MSEHRTLQEIVLAAHERMPRAVWDFVMGGSESETTLRRNRQALDSLGFRPHAFRDVRRVDVSTTLLGHPSAMPLVLAPMGSISLIDPEGALAAARAAAELGLVSFMSSVADPGPERLAAQARCPLVYTLYVQGDRDWIDRKLALACELGFTAIAVLGDTAYYSRRDRDVMNRLNSKVDPATTYARLQRLTRARSSHPVAPEELEPTLHAAGVTWETLEHIKRRIDVPLIVKGIGSGEAAHLAIDHGADVVYVSNHGGRQLDHQPGTAEILPEVVDAVRRRAAIIVDGGCMRGADIVKAIALGANAVGIGRLQALALGAGGAPALIRALEILEEELVVDMGLLGASSLAELGPHHVRPVIPVAPAHPLNPFPVVMERLHSPHEQAPPGAR